MKKLLTILGTIGTIGLSAATVVACGVNQSEKVKHDLETVVKETHLGHFLESPSDDELLVKAKEKNDDLQIDHIDVIENNGFSNVTIAVKEDSDHYHPATLTLTFTVDKIALETDLENNDLGVFRNDPSDEDILTKIKELNPTVWIEDLEVSSKTETEATIQVKTESMKYEDDSQVIVSFEVIPLPLVTRDIRNYHVAGVSEYDQRQILTMIRLLNRNLKMDELEVVSDNQVNVIILGVKADSDYYAQGTARFTYRVSSPVRLDKVVFNTNLGEILNSSDETILKVLGDLNRHLYIEDIVVVSTNGVDEAVINVAPRSNRYSRSPVTLTFTLDERKVLEDDFSETALGVFSTRPTNEAILARFGELNPNVDLDHVEVSYSNGQTTAIIKVKEGSTVYQPATDIYLTYTVAR